MSGYNTQFQNVVAFFMKRFGTDATITVEDGTGTYIDSNWIPNVSTIPVRVIPLDYIKKSDGLTTSTGTEIQTGDKQVFIQPTVSLQTINPAFTTLQMDGKSWKFVAVKNLNTTLADSVYFECYVRA